MSKIIVIAGTPGTGKKTIGTLVSSRCGFPVVNLSTVALEKGFVVYYDEERQTYVINEEKLIEHIAMIALSSDKPIVVLTHYPEIIPRELVSMVFVLRTHPLELEKRLKDRGWSSRKVNENVMAEILGVVAHNALQAFGEDLIYELDTTSTVPENVADIICMAVEHKQVIKPGVKIDWLSQLSLEDITRFRDYEGGDNQ